MNESVPLTSDGQIDYEAAGIKPPEHIDHLTDTQRDQIFAQLKRQPHIWKQEPCRSGGGGWDIFCDNGHARHGFYTTEFILRGTLPDGMPDLHKIVAQPNMA